MNTGWLFSVLLSRIAAFVASRTDVVLELCANKMV
jgi:hypothetical protein